MTVARGRMRLDGTIYIYLDMQEQLDSQGKESGEKENDICKRRSWN